MNTKEAFVQSLHSLREYLNAESPEKELTVQKAQGANSWFIPSFIRQSILAIVEEYLDEEKCKKWLAAYPENPNMKRIAIIMAGNIPLVGFHDLLCVLASGHSATIKLSDKDQHLLPFVIHAWKTILPSLASSIHYEDRLTEFDAIITTGSNNSARYFEYYFRVYPHLLRKNRNGVAILTGSETPEELKNLARDIFLYFGLGCRNVSKVFVPEGYDFKDWEEAIAEWKHLESHHSYKNNLDYNYAIFVINRIPHLHLGHLILKEEEAIASRIGCVHYSYYRDMNVLRDVLQNKREEIQCVVSGSPVDGWDHVSFGQSQQPRLDQYADGVDTMSFLSAL